MEIDFEDAENNYEYTEDFYERISKPFLSTFSGRCAVDNTHIVKKNTWVARVQRADNPMLPVTGVACATCVKMLRRVSK